MAFKMKGFSGFKSLGDEKTKKKATSKKENLAAVGAGEAEDSLNYVYRDADRGESSIKASYTSAQRKEMIKLGIDPKDRMAYAAKNF